MSKFIKFSDCTTEKIIKTPYDLIISGEPVHTSWPHFISKDAKACSGVWHSTSGVFYGPMNNQIEFCHIIEGEALIKVDDGTEFIVKPGDSFVMDNKLNPVWHVKDFVKKHFVIVSV